MVTRSMKDTGVNMRDSGAKKPKVDRIRSSILDKKSTHTTM